MIVEFNNTTYLRRVDADDFYIRSVQVFCDHLIEIGANMRDIGFDQAKALFEKENYDEFCSCSEADYISCALSFAAIELDACKIDTAIYENSEKLSHELCAICGIAPSSLTD